MKKFMDDDCHSLGITHPVTIGDPPVAESPIFFL
jgi:hypothetical protein